MSPESGDDVQDSEWERPVVLPVFQIPSRLATGIAWGLVASAALSIIAALVTAVSYRQPALPRGIIAPGLRITQPSIGVGDRVSLFANGSGDLTMALLVVIAVVVIAMAARQGEVRNAVTHWRALLTATCAIGLIVLLANVAKAIVILINSAGQVSGVFPDNKVSNILSLSPPALIGAGALLYATSRLRNSPESSSEGNPQPPLETDT